MIYYCVSDIFLLRKLRIKLTAHNFYSASIYIAFQAFRKIAWKQCGGLLWERRRKVGLCLAKACLNQG